MAMFFNKIYYQLKPIMPWRLRVALRRWRANSRRISNAEVWPIDEKAGRTPPGWPGWPEGKRFALVLTHDVEGKKGFERVERLMNLELKHGFHSSFNFVPKGEYQLTEALRTTLDRNGFEIGVHGLEHDGKLYDSKAGFALKAAGIKKYLKSWNACGFRSPLMQHRLSWLHELGVEYDCSTFDTDPFEPEPDGVGTIFPFWVPSPNGSGYVELPYSLPQDFTLFVVLNEQNIDIWKRKLDWIAASGGMALLNTHPDYMTFDGAKKDRDEFPVSYYEEFLAYARDKYAGVSWPALPREVSRYYCSALPPESRNTRKKVCMLTHSLYQNDNRVRRYAETLAKRGDRVEVFALGNPKTEQKVEEINGVNLYRIQSRDYEEHGRWTYAWRLLRFLRTSSVFITRRHRQIRYDLVHVHNVPDFLVFAAWYPRLMGAKLILDIHDIVPEFFASKFDTKEESMYIMLLKEIEKASASFVDHVIVSNHLWHKKLIARSVSERKSSVFLNHVDPALFYPHARTRNNGKFVVLFPGTFAWHQGLDIAIEAFAIVKQKVPNAEFHIYGTGDQQAELVRLADRLGLNGSVQFRGGVNCERIPDVIVNADLGVVPKRSNSFGNEAYSTKIMEFMSQGVPVVVSRTKIDNFYFNESVVHFFQPGDVQAMAKAMLEVIENESLRKALVAGGLEYAARNSWAQKREEYLDLVDTLSVEEFAHSNGSKSGTRG
jgi:glycosyltransferase involved in cell wall biosynthesis